jgi:hypothetical protein
MAHAKLLKVHDASLTAAIKNYLAGQPVAHPAIAGSIMQTVQAHRKDDAAELGALPPDAHVTAHYVDPASGEVSLIVESQAFPWTPDGVPLNQMAVIPTTAVAPEAEPAAPEAPEVPA